MAAGRSRVFLETTSGTEPLGRLTIELFTDHTPKTCENFRQLCTGEHNGLSYAGAPFHRVIDEFMIQGGDIANGDGTGTTSIYGGEFEDENLQWREMDAAGLVCAANRGKDTNGSQFFITLESCPHLNGKHTIFGRLVSGQDVLEQIGKVKVDNNDVPVVPVLIARCGELEKRKKAKVTSEDIPAPAQNVDGRGRPRTSDASTDGRLAGEYRDTEPRKRRQSDNVIDEGIRGRPRQRSASSQGSRAASSMSGDSNHSRSSSRSRVEKHKRKRSQSPSRHQDRRFSNEHSRRRRRSLPNQYQEMRRVPHQQDHDQHRRYHRDDHTERSFRRQHDRYRPRDAPRRDHSERWDDIGRLGNGDYDEHSGGGDPPVKFKGRGNMKYRENRHDGRL